MKEFPKAVDRKVPVVGGRDRLKEGNFMVGGDWNRDPQGPSKGVCDPTGGSERAFCTVSTLKAAGSGLL